MKIGDIVMSVMNEHKIYDICVGDNSLFTDIYDKLNKKPMGYFEAWKSSVINRLKKDNRFEFTKVTKGLNGNYQHVIELKEEFRTV